MKENEYRNYAPGAPRYSNWLGSSLLALAGFLVGLQVINASATQTIWRPYLGVQTKKLERIAQLAEKIDVLFIGTSHVENGIDPLTFDSAMGKCGQPTFSFNAGVGNLRGPELRHYLASIGSIPGFHPRYIFIEPLINTAPQLDRLYSSRTRFHFSPTAVMHGIDARWGADIPLGRKLASIGVQALAASVHQLNLGVLSDVFLPRCPECESSERESGPMEERPSRPFNRGYAGEAGDPQVLSHVKYEKWMQEHPNDRMIDEAGLRAQPRTLSPGELEYLGGLLHEITKIGAEPILVNPPLVWDLLDSRSVSQGLKDHFPQVMAFPYYWDGERLLSLYWNTRAWYDHGHLSPYGAVLFSRQLAADFCSRVEARKRASVSRAVH